MESIVLVVHIVLAMAIIGFVMLQQGKGADAGASFGGGASQTVFGSSGSGNFLSKTTGVLAAAFFVTSLGLGVYAKQRSELAVDLGIPSQQAIEKLENDMPVVEEYAPSSDVPELDASGADKPVVEDTAE